MLPRQWLLSLLFPLGTGTYHAACIAMDPGNKTVYISETFEKVCAELASCRVEVGNKWAAFLKKEGLAQATGATWRCEMYKDGSTPDESPRSRIRKWRDEEAAQAQSGPIKYDKVVQTKFGPD